MNMRICSYSGFDPVATRYPYLVIGNEQMREEMKNKIQEEIEMRFANCKMQSWLELKKSVASSKSPPIVLLVSSTLQLTNVKFILNQNNTTNKREICN